MKDIKVLGTGCAKCQLTVKLLEEAAKAKGVEITLEKIEDIQKIMTYDIMATPAVVIDGKVVHAGGIPARDKVASWF
ncbi:MAG: thioredoxin family protein [Methylotenera sp.]